MRLIEVPVDVAETARAALATRLERGGGGTARAVVLATALGTGAVRPHELGEIRSWHSRNPDACTASASTLLGGMYGGPEGRAWCAAALNPEGVGAMISLPVEERVTKELARPDGEPADAMHLTLFHLGSDAASLDPGLRDQVVDVLQRVTPGLAAPSFDLSHVERFTAYEEGLEPVVVVSDEPAVYTLRDQLAAALDAAGVPYSTNHAFRAHVTIGYYPPGDGPSTGPVGESLGSGPLDLDPQLVALHWGDDVVEFPLAQPSAQTAGARLPVNEKLSRLSDRVNRIDRTTVTRIHAAANLALEEALRNAQVKLTVRGNRNAKTAAAMSAADGRVTPALLAAVGVTEQELLDRRFDVFGTTALALLTAAEIRKLRAAALALNLDADELEDEYAAEIDRRAALAAGFLVAGLSVLARAALSGHTIVPEDQQGEFAGPVPFGLVRQAWAVSARGATPPLIDESGPGPAPVDDIAERAVNAGRSLTEQIIVGELGDLVLVKTWRHGEPLRPFDPHDRLDGRSWIDADHGGILDADPSEWPYVDEYEPGDHDGCTCWLDSTYETLPTEAP
jgi:hypothetical protein